MVTIKTKEEIELLKEAGKRQALYFKELKANVCPGVSADFLDKLAFKLITERGDKPAFLNYKPGKSSKSYPNTLCISVNDEVVHSPPHKTKIFKEGDIVCIDMGLSHKGMIVDSAITIPVGKVDKEAKRLIKITRECLDKAVVFAKAGNFTGDIGRIIEKTAKDAGFSIAENLSGHGVGYEVHEDPYVPNFGKKGEGVRLESGMVIAIEPILCEGSGRIILGNDGHTIKTKDGKRGAHFEHTVVITEDRPIVVTKL